MAYFREFGLANYINNVILIAEFGKMFVNGSMSMRMNESDSLTWFKDLDCGAVKCKI